MSQGLDLPKQESIAWMPIDSLRQLRDDLEVEAGVEALKMQRDLERDEEMARMGGVPTDQEEEGGSVWVRRDGSFRQGTQGPPGGSMKSKDAELAQLKQRMQKQAQDNLELSKVVVESQRRLAEANEQTAKMLLEMKSQHSLPGHEGKVRYNTTMVDAGLQPAESTDSGSGGWKGREDRSLKRASSQRGGYALSRSARDVLLSEDTTCGDPSGTAHPAAPVETSGNRAVVEMTAVQQFDVGGGAAVGEKQWVESQSMQRGRIEQVILRIDWLGVDSTFLCAF